MKEFEDKFNTKYTIPLKKSVADRFGVSKDTAWETTMTIARVLNEQAPTYIRWLVSPEFVTVEQDFAELAGFPGVVAAVDGTHIEVNAPSNDEYSYFNRKHYHSVILQGICNSNKKFVDVLTGVCGSIHDTRVWHISHINEAIENGPDRYCLGERHTLGDSAYPLQYTLLPSYRDDGHLTEIERNYNTVLSKTRVQHATDLVAAIEKRDVFSALLIEQRRNA
ncbi:putative nuclease HARBI1 [Belonocnema kinseyi]|uniref:putative nuclease HARBI1 n=1 Tax=Belonocnema kinseyi TaxID=2817044 RepID=UPI00143D1E2D|nr:putative nuclease HARBI1 [Belonocnema kinseyi]